MCSSVWCNLSLRERERACLMFQMIFNQLNSKLTEWDKWTLQRNIGQPPTPPVFIAPWVPLWCGFGTGMFFSFIQLSSLLLWVHNLAVYIVNVTFEEGNEKAYIWRSLAIFVLDPYMEWPFFFFLFFKSRSWEMFNRFLNIDVMKYVIYNSILKTACRAAYVVLVLFKVQDLRQWHQKCYW